MRKTFNRSTAITLALLGATVVGSLSAVAARADNPPLNETAAVESDFKPVGDFTNLVKRVTPAVVSITVHLKLDQTADDSGDNGNNSGGNNVPPGFPQLPGFPPGFPFGPAPQQPQAVEAKGSGFIINSNGTIVTNNHVVKGAQSVSVTLSDGTSYPAKVVGTDPKTDLAVVKITVGHPLPYVELGQSKDVEPGEWVVAMGNPFGLGGTVTAGIVSALGRNIGDGPYDRFIQIDAPINEGNSGGPLFNQRGQVIGINTAILTPTGGSVGIGFAIPSEMVQRVVSQLIASGKVTRGYLGVAAQQISPEMAQAIGLPTADPANDGALVAAVSDGSPAARAGLKPGDVITAVNGVKVSGPSDLAADIANIDPNHDATITYTQDGKSHDLSVVVTTMPADPNAGFQIGGSNNAAPGTSHASLGLTLAPLTFDSRSQLNLPNNASGAVIVSVAPNSFADQAGLQPGDLLVSVGSKAVTSPDEAVTAIDAARKAGAKAIALRIIRQGESLFVGIDLTKHSQG
jgi:serine protease Do